MTSYPQLFEIATPGPPDGLFFRLVAATSRLTQALLTEVLRRRAIRELRHLDDHMLADIGLERDQIDVAVRFGRDSLVVRMPRG